MRLEQSFTVAAPVEEVWRALVDVQRVAPCLPGAEVTESDEEGVYRGLFTVKLGPTTVAYAGTLRMERVDEQARTAVMAARGSDRRGQGGATATIASTVRAEGEGTAVDVVTDFTITGRLARFGRGGMIADVSRRLLGDFAACLQTRLGERPAAAAAPGGEPAPGREAVAPDGSAAAAPSGEPAPSGEAATPAAGPAPAAAAAAPPPPPGAPPPAPAARPLDAGKLGRQVLWERIRGWWSRLGRRLRRRGQPG